MDSEEKKEDLVESLHNKSLPSLRTYQGDVATFIKNKDQSVVGLAIKNREEKEKKEERQKVIEKPVKAEGSSPGLLIYALSILLILATAGTVSYLIYNQFKNAPVVVENSSGLIIRSDKTATLDASTLDKQILVDTIISMKSDGENGINALSIVDPVLKEPIKTKDFLAKTSWQIPAPLQRSLYDQFMLGTYIDKGGEFFLILQTNDYGIAFRDMLVWENTMFEDLKPLLNTARETVDYSGYKFKDLIVKNKDTRSFSSPTGKTVLIYSFLNPNTILITESENSITSIINTYITRTTIR